MYCAYCGKEIPNESIFCRHCGKKQDNFSSSNRDELPKKLVSQPSSSIQQQSTALEDKKNYKGVETLIFIVAFFIMILFKFGPEIKDAFYEATPRENPVHIAAKSLISDQVVSPSSITWKKVDILEQDEYGRYLVDVQFESKNQFGVTIPSYFIVILQSVKPDGGCTYSPFYAVNDYEAESLRSLGIHLAKTLNKWGIPPESSEDNDYNDIDTNMDTENNINNEIDVPETSGNTYPDVITDIPTDNKLLTDVQILNILEQASCAEYKLYTSYDEATLENGMVKLSPEFSTVEKIESYLSTYWSDEDINRIKYNIIFKDGIAYVPYGDPAAPKEFTKGEVAERKFTGVYDDNHNIVGDILMVTVELTVYGELQYFWYDISYDNVTNSWRVMTLY